MENPQKILKSEFNANSIQEGMKYFWELTKTLENNSNPVLNNLQTYYTRLCKTYGKYLGMPKRTFGPTTMCKHCSALWKPGNHTIRIIKGKRPGAKLQKLIDTHNEYSQYSKSRTSLIKKCKENKSQKIRMKCLNCNKNTEIALRKPKRTKIIKPVDTPSINIKKKKKKRKDKFCNLNISMNSTLNNSSFNDSLNNSIRVPSDELKNNITTITPSIKKNKGQKTPLNNKTLSNNKSNVNKLTSLQKASRINKMKLENVLKNSSSEKNRNSLSSFLNELF